MEKIKAKIEECRISAENSVKSQEWQCQKLTKEKVELILKEYDQKKLGKNSSYQEEKHWEREERKIIYSKYLTKFSSQARCDTGSIF